MAMTAMTTPLTTTMQAMTMPKITTSTPTKTRSSDCRSQLCARFPRSFFFFPLLSRHRTCHLTTLLFLPIKRSSSFTYDRTGTRHPVFPRHLCHASYVIVATTRFSSYAIVVSMPTPTLPRTHDHWMKTTHSHLGCWYSPYCDKHAFPLSTTK